MKPIYSRSPIFRLPGSGLLALLAGLFFAGNLFATQSLYQNFSDLNYFIPGNPPPMIDASNFDNENQFNVSFDDEGLNAQFYEPENTVNYTNNSSGINTGIMTVNSPLLTNSVGELIDYNFIGVGFQFDTQITNTLTHLEAGTFYNSGDIRCDSVLDGNNVYSFDGFSEFIQFDVGQCLVWATNVICPGTIETGANGFISLTGENVNLSRSDLTIEGLALSTSNVVDGGINSEGEGYNTNLDWDPALDLTPTNAYSSLPDDLYLTNSTPYYSETANNVLRSVFLQNDNTNVPYSVYVAPSAEHNEGALVQWTGTYVDPASGMTVSNYLYLYHFYLTPGTTNFGQVVEFGAPVGNLDFQFFEGGVPRYYNYVWSQSTPLAGLTTPNPSNYPSLFNNNIITNIYEYFNGSLAGATTGTNASASNPSGALTNLPARIQITAGTDLKLAFAQITGENYLALTATNQFDGSAGATIYFPYGDINLGVTNGAMTVSNLVSQNIPSWGGILQEWSTSWTNLDVNSNLDDLRVMLVNSDLTPTVSPQIQNLTLNATNSLVISDVLNVFGSLLATPRSLTLTTNGVGNGASSVEGKLNLLNANPSTYSWSGSFPNLLWLTNDGSLLLPNYSDFIANTQQVIITPAIPAVAATATLSEAGGTNVAGNSTVTVGGLTYTFTNSISSKSLPNAVKIGTTFDGSMSNLIAAINASPGVGTIYSVNTFANSTASAGLLATHAFTVTANTANYPGLLGNGISSTTTATNLTWNASVLSGGANAVAAVTNSSSSSVAYGAIINHGVLIDQGSTIWANNFLSDGAISNNTGSFLLTALTATITNGVLQAGGDVSIMANTLLTSNLMLQAGRSLTLQITNAISDTGPTNGNIWLVGSTNGTGGNGLVMPVKPASGDLLGTIISTISPAPNKEIDSTWAGLDYGVSTAGYANNVAIGQLTLDALGFHSTYYFTGTGADNAMYVDQLVLKDYASYTNGLGSGSITSLLFNTNLVIYYADAVASGQDISYELNNANGGHLRWVPQYVGYFSGTNVVYSNGTTNRVNKGILADPYLDSNGSGNSDINNPDPIFVASELNFKVAQTNLPSSMLTLTWDSIPSSTNYILYSTNLVNWSVVTNFVSPSTVPPAGGWPITNTIFEPLSNTAPQGYYRVRVSPNSADEYGN